LNVRLLRFALACVAAGFLEQAEKLSVDLVGDEGEILRTMLVIQVISLYDEDLAFIIRDPFLVAVIKIAQILDADALLVVAATFLNL
jgi:hypothetical protein